MILINKDQFLIEHNKLSPINLQVTLSLLTQFQEEKRPLLKNNGWCIDKLRIPLVLWLISLPPEKNKRIRKPKKQSYKNYPETK